MFNSSFVMNSATTCFRRLHSKRFIRLHPFCITLRNGQFKLFTDHSRYLCSKPMQDEKKSLYGELEAKIKATGPLTIASYMKEVLTNPVSGYYMNKDVFGKSGDFTTSPEICQLFGEMVAVWFVNEWFHVGKPKPLQLIELGPGRGTMLEDVLRVFHKLQLDDGLSVCLVEVSPTLSILQSERLCLNNVTNCNDASYYKHGVTKDGVNIYWYKSVYDIKGESFSLLIAHEFFDALPIHKFQKTEAGWREVLIDIDNTPNRIKNKFCYCISREPTPYSTLFIPKDETRDHIEISVDSILHVQHLANHFEKYGGIGLVIDYGHCGTKTDTFRAFRSHSQSDPLFQPGLADLTADVDFNVLRKSIEDKLLVFGPVTQRQFLSQMQIAVRLELLLSRCQNQEHRKSLISGYNMIMDEDKMGTSFFVMSFFPMTLKEHFQKFPVCGFSEDSF